MLCFTDGAFDGNREVAYTVGMLLLPLEGESLLLVGASDGFNDEETDGDGVERDGTEETYFIFFLEAEGFWLG